MHLVYVGINWHSPLFFIYFPGSPDKEAFDNPKLSITGVAVQYSDSICTLRNIPFIIGAEIPGSFPPIDCSVELGNITNTCDGSKDDDITCKLEIAIDRTGVYNYTVTLEHLVYGSSTNTINVTVVDGGEELSLMWSHLD